MAHKTPTTRARDVARELSRRSLIRWTVASAAALGLRPWRAFEILEDSAGAGLAQAASVVTTNRSVHIIGGNGGFAWFQLLWPHNAVAAAGNAQFAYHAPGQQVMASGTDRPLTLAPQAPWKTVDGRLQVTAMMAGNNETHTSTPTSSSTIDNGVSIFATAAALQAVNPTLIPAIAIDDAPFGAAPGAPAVARVPGPDDIVGLFNSAVSREGGLLANTGDAEMYSATFKALVSLNAAAANPGTRRSLDTSKAAASLLGTNLASRLAPTTADLTRYGISGTTPTRVADFGKSLIITAKAFSLGLASTVSIQAFKDDPHGAFNDMANLVTTVTAIGASLDAFRNDLATLAEPGGGGKLIDNFVMSIHGDTPKTPLNRGGWPDGTPGDSNWVYVYGGGMLKTGWFGGIQANGTVVGWNPVTGDDANVASNTTSAPASAAIAYAIAKGDMRRVREFYRGAEVTGVVRPAQM